VLLALDVLLFDLDKVLDLLLVVLMAQQLSVLKNNKKSIIDKEHKFARKIAQQFN
jgi:hypothetical protein